LKLSLKGNRSPGQFGFYSTYEELKLRILTYYFAVSIRFYSTYEELKLPGQDEESDESLSFYSTYEELKHCWPESAAAPKSVFTVPMRN